MLSSDKALQPAPPLPTKLSDWHRRIKAERTLNDLVEDVHRALLADDKLSPAYLGYLRAVYDSQAVDGSCVVDDFQAARMIKSKAEELGMAELADEKLLTIMLALRVVLRRYGQSRMQRRQMLRGEIVPNNNDE